MCYLQLWNAAVRKHPDDLEDDMDGGDDKKYSIFAVATAMYLMLSIVAADLWGAVALLVEKPHFWCGQRKLFGLFLLVSFCLLMISSTRVLLFTSLDDEELVIGAAAVLFIADVVSQFILSNILHGIDVFPSSYLGVHVFLRRFHVKLRSPFSIAFQSGIP